MKATEPCPQCDALHPDVVYRVGRTAVHCPVCQFECESDDRDSAVDLWNRTYAEKVEQP